MNIETEVKNILTTHGLDFKIKKGPLTFTDDDGTTYLTPYYGLQNAKTKETINTCKEGYTVSQNDEITRMVLEGISKFGTKVKVQKAGSLHGGRKIYFQLEIQGTAKVGKDIVIQYVTVIDSNDGSSGLSVGIGDKVMRCQNQFFLFYKGSNAKFRHTTTIKDKIASIPELVEVALDKSMKQIKTYEKFLSTPLTKELAHKMVKEVLGYDRMFTSAEKMAKQSKRSEKIMDTLYDAIAIETNASGENVWGLFNGLTRFITNQNTKEKRENGYVESMLLGTNYKKANKGFRFLTKELA